ncbi:Eco57I restriction-modification methylase domain-containing protein [Telluribacter sp. SYSU D00476]|uniref:Eco57I restriction-modification methylase domain-containing protein n=1 Tax=Telluribacter sp. SYSU D00476 TaxID=2811430 RepID=UPI001FF1F133|nr:TaqI-like C-terminal specificity domain-containing protein [Telluribacter sp. SYSU D00476]
MLIAQKEQEIESIENNSIYKGSFEWRFEFPEVLDEKGDYRGFDIVIGNPPYIRQEEISSQKPYLKANYQTYTGATDLYVFFVERGMSILKPGGQFSYIMPNKRMQAGYGKPLRSYLLTNQLQSIIDFGDLKVFDEATTYPCIISVSKGASVNSFISVGVDTLIFENGFGNYVDRKAISLSVEELNDETWVVSSDEEQRLLSRLKTGYIPLSEYVEEKAFRGVLTGLTEAFVVDKETKKQIIENGEDEIGILRPFMLGRDIKRYSIPVPNKYLILFQKGISNDMREGADAEAWFENTYPSIYKYLAKYKEKAIIKGDKGDYWWELRACDYYEEFSKPKIMYRKFQVKPCFIYDEEGVYCNDSMWVITKADKVLLAILNSNMGWWLISKYCTAIQNGYQLIWNYFKQIPIPKATTEQAKPIVTLVDKIISTKKTNPNSDVSHLEAEIDKLVYELYNLSQDEINIIKP